MFGSHFARPVTGGETLNAMGKAQLYGRIGGQRGSRVASVAAEGIAFIA